MGDPKLGRPWSALGGHQDLKNKDALGLHRNILAEHGEKRVRTCLRVGNREDSEQPTHASVNKSYCFIISFHMVGF